jgi:hypothetical protein
MEAMSMPTTTTQTNALPTATTGIAQKVSASQQIHRRKQTNRQTSMHMMMSPKSVSLMVITGIAQKASASPPIHPQKQTNRQTNMLMTMTPRNVLLMAITGTVRKA